MEGGEGEGQGRPWREGDGGKVKTFNSDTGPLNVHKEEDAGVCIQAGIAQAVLHHPLVFSTLPHHTHVTPTPVELADQSVEAAEAADVKCEQAADETKDNQRQLRKEGGASRARQQEAWTPVWQTVRQTADGTYGYDATADMAHTPEMPQPGSQMKPGCSATVLTLSASLRSSPISKLLYSVAILSTHLICHSQEHK